MKKIVAIIPSLNPNEKLVSVCKELKDSGIEYVVVNDGSKQEFEYIFKKVNDWGIVLKHDANKGKGCALKTAMKYILDNYKDCVVVCVDGDGQHLIKDVINVANSVDDNSLVLGVRRFDKKKVPFKSYYGNKITEFIFKIFTGRHISDTQTGLRAFSYQLINEMLKIEGDRYEYEMNQLLYSIRNNIDIKEIEISTIYEGNNELSHFNPLKDSFLIYKQLLKFSLSSFGSFLVDYILFIIFSNIFVFNNSVLYANISARFFSSIFNYEVNKNVVFKSKNNKSLIKYFGLVFLILAANTLILYFMTYIFNIPKSIGKIFTEVIMFIFSWTVQKNYVFKEVEKQ